MSDVKNFQKLLGYEFKDSDLLQSALTHKSYTRVKNNERLEFLGDAVIDLLIGEYLFLKFPEHKEGQLSKMRASLVSEKSLYRYAQKVELGIHIYLSISEDNNKGREKPSILSSAFEAIIGAVYLESGIEVCRDILYTLTEKIYPNIDFDSVFSDYKTTLQEVTQAHFGTIPEYILQKTSGPDHQKKFEIAVVIEGRVYATELGNSKKDAQQKAAQIALIELNKELNK